MLNQTLPIGLKTKPEEANSTVTRAALADGNEDAQGTMAYTDGLY